MAFVAVHECSVVTGFGRRPVHERCNMRRGNGRRSKAANERSRGEGRTDIGIAPPLQRGGLAEA